MNFYYSDSIDSFLKKTTETIIGEISIAERLGYLESQLFAWEAQIRILKNALGNLQGHIYFEFSIPRMGKRVDCLLIIHNIVFIIEFKVGENKYNRKDIEQVWDYALDLKNFHGPSHHSILVPILIATEANDVYSNITQSNDFLVNPILC